MTDIFNEITAALSNRNTTANAIIWTNANASWFKKRSSRGGRSSRRRFSSRKEQRTPISKDTATLFKKKSSGGSRRRRSRRKKQKRELTLELNSNVSLVNKAPTTSKHAKGTFSIWPISSIRKMLRNSFLLVVMFAILFLSKLLTGTLFTFDNDLPAFGCKDSFRSMNADFCFEKLPTVAFPPANHTHQNKLHANIYGAPISFQQANEDTQDFLVLSNENTADDFERGCSMYGSSVQQKIKNNKGKISILFGRSGSTLLGGNALPNENDAADFGILERGCSMDGNCQQQKTTNQDTVELSCGTSRFVLLDGSALLNGNNAGNFDILEHGCSIYGSCLLPEQKMNNTNNNCFCLNFWVVGICFR